MPAEYLVNLRQGGNRRFFKRLRAIKRGALGLHLYVTQAIVLARGAEYLVTLRQGENRRVFECLRANDRGAFGLRLYVT